MRRAWVLNFDAELELEARGAYAPSAEMRARVRALAEDFATTLPTGDVVVDPPLEARAWTSLEGFVPRAWMPTPRACATFRDLGLSLDAPPLAVLARVNERGFAAALADPDELPGAARATSIDQVERHVAAASVSGDWLLKRAFAVAGRGQRALHPGPLSAGDRAFVAASIAKHGAIHVEPRVSIVRELSMHGWVGDARPRSFRAQAVANGAFVRSSRVSPDRAVREPLEATFGRVAAALEDAGYRGPFGIDAFEWELAGVRRLRALSEINARHCMGWDDADGW